jgi:PD-(D/E)XK nuclease superfamily
VIDAVDRTDLLVTSLEHLLLLSMLQHPSGTWRWGRYVGVYPAGNSDFAEAYGRYEGLLADSATFGSATIEGLLDGLPAKTATALRDRYIS